MNVVDAVFGFLRRIGILNLGASMPIEATGGESTFKLKPGGFKPRWIILHHSYSTDGETRNWDAIWRYHMSYRYAGEIITYEQYLALVQAGHLQGLEKPWQSIGYHFGIENVNGHLVVLPGRQIGEVGAHALGFNDKSIGICLVGNYNLDPPSEERLYLLSHLCRSLQLEFGIPRDQVIGHRETYGKLTPPQPVAKMCPGTLFDLEAFRSRLRD